MPSIRGPSSGDILLFDIDEERESAPDPDLIDRSGRHARTLLATGPLRVTLVVPGPGGARAKREAAGQPPRAPVSDHDVAHLSAAAEGQAPGLHREGSIHEPR